MVFGTFDILHKGHEDYFKQAKEYGDFLIVIVAKDENVKYLKSQSSHYNEKKRLHNVQEISIVDKARLGNISDRLKVIEEEKPDIICLGYDQEVNEAELSSKLNKRGLNIIIKRMNGFKINKYKSSILKEKRS